MITLKIKYKKGTTLEQKVHYVHFEDGKLVFTQVKQVASAVQEQIRVSIENIESFDITLE